jgi:hypothetical protein
MPTDWSAYDGPAAGRGLRRRRPDRRVRLGRDRGRPRRRGVRERQDRARQRHGLRPAHRQRPPRPRPAVHGHVRDHADHQPRPDRPARGHGRLQLPRLPRLRRRLGRAAAPRRRRRHHAPAARTATWASRPATASRSSSSARASTSGTPWHELRLRGLRRRRGRLGRRRPDLPERVRLPPHAADRGRGRHRPLGAHRPAAALRRDAARRSRAPPTAATCSRPAGGTSGSRTRPAPS